MAKAQRTAKVSATTAGQAVDDDGKPVNATQTPNNKAGEQPAFPAQTSGFDKKYPHLYARLAKDDELLKWLDQFLAGITAAYGADNLNKKILQDRKTIHSIARRYALVGDMADLKNGGKVVFDDRESDDRFEISANSISFSDASDMEDNFTPQDAYDMAILASLNRDMVKKGVTLNGSDKQKMLLRLAVEHVNKTLPEGQKIKINEKAGIHPFAHRKAEKEWKTFAFEISDEGKKQKFQHAHYIWSMNQGAPKDLLKNYLGSDKLAEAAQYVVDSQQASPDDLQKALNLTSESVQDVLATLEKTGFVSEPREEDHQKRDVLIDKETLTPRTFETHEPCFAAACLRGIRIDNLQGIYNEAAQRNEEMMSRAQNDMMRDFLKSSTIETNMELWETILERSERAKPEPKAA